MDDPSLADLTRTDQPGLPGYMFAGTESPVAIAFKKRAAELGLDPNAPIGPGGRNAQGLAYSWLPYDPLQSTSGTGSGHVKYGPTVDDPIFGRLQSTYTEPSKAKAARERTAMLAFAAAVSAITAGAGSSLIGPAFSAATKYGMGGGIDPTSLAISLALGQVPGGLGAIDPSLASAYKIGTTALGAANVANQARRGNYDPALNTAAGIGLRELTRGLA